MSIITLTTDFGLKDHYVASLKGAILSCAPNVTIVDVSHDSDKHNLQSVAHLLGEAYKNFPEKTIHIIGVKTEYTGSRGYVVVEHDNHYFVTADNGIFSLMFEEPPTTVYEFMIDKTQNLSFITRDFFVPIACRLLNGEDLSSIGKPKDDLLRYMPFTASLSGDTIRGAVAYIDSYGNVISNIHRRLFEQAGETRPFSIEFLRGYKVDAISKEYSDVVEGEVVALFNVSGYLELAIRDGNIARLLQLKLNAQINVYLE